MARELGIRRGGNHKRHKMLKGGEVNGEGVFQPAYS